MDTKLRALNRFGLGARPGERQSIDDPREWLRRQLRGDPPAADAPGIPSREEISSALRAFRQGGQNDRQQRQQARRRLIEILAREQRNALTQRAVSTRPFVERLVTFWANHLCVSTGAKVLVAPLAGAYEREAIRPYVLGRFEDMVMASAKHPAMLIYLDNFQSIGPTSRGARQTTRGGRRGLNENYARELLELHTVGVNGGYTQTDVLELARILTGWTVAGLGGPGAARIQAPARGRGRRRDPIRSSADSSLGFVFQELLHEPGARTVMGVRYADSGVQQGERVIRDLCRHSSTATFIATKLVTHFVADEAPARAVDAVAAVFRQTEGDLRAVSSALIDLPEAWRGDTQKFRPPQDWLVAALRALEVAEINDRLAGALRQLRQPLWSPQAPKGYGDSVQEWADPDSLLNRAELARTLARTLQGREEARALLDVMDLGSGDPLRTMLADASIPRSDRLALALAGPAFQWR